MKPQLRNESGAFDLPSIMAAVVVVGILTAGVLAAMVGVIPFSQDNAAKRDLGAIQTAQGAARTQHGGYGNKERLAALGLINPLSADTRVTVDGAGFCAVRVSQTGRIYSVSSADNLVHEGDICPAAPDPESGAPEDPPVAGPEDTVPASGTWAAPGYEGMCGATNTLSGVGPLQQ